MRKLILFVMAGLLLSGCATSIKDMSVDYTDSSTAIREFAKISAADWQMGTGIIMGALGKEALPSWVYTEIGMVNMFIESYGADELDDYMLGYMFGLRLRLASPIIRAAIEQYAPGIMDIKEVIGVLTFLGG